MSKVTYYTCDQCEWAGTLDGAHVHWADTRHDSFSKREPKPVLIPSVQEYQYQAPCDHLFAWHGVIPPSHCVKCGASLNRTWDPINPITYGTTTVTHTPYSSTSNAILTWKDIKGEDDEPDAGVASKR